MHVLTLSGQTPAQDDFHWGREGELAFPGLVCCRSHECGCSRAFAGIETHQAGTVLRVVDSPMSRDGMLEACRHGMVAAGWSVLTEDDIAALVDQNVSAAVQHAPGALLRPHHAGGDAWLFETVYAPH